jgi:hypothetical protein
MKLRQNIVNATNRVLETTNDLNIDTMEVYNLILEYHKETKKPVFKMDIKIDNGCLYIDNVFIKRVSPLIRPFNVYDEMADYYENKILAMNEIY